MSSVFVVVVGGGGGACVCVCMCACLHGEVISLVYRVYSRVQRKTAGLRVSYIFAEFLLNFYSSVFFYAPSLPSQYSYWYCFVCMCVRVWIVQHIVFIVFGYNVFQFSCAIALRFVLWLVDVIDDMAMGDDGGMAMIMMIIFVVFCYAQQY